MLTLEQAVLECYKNKELVTEWERLTGNTMTDTREPIDRMIDNTTGNVPFHVAAGDVVAALTVVAVWLEIG